MGRCLLFAALCLIVLGECSGNIDMDTMGRQVMAAINSARRGMGVPELFYDPYMQSRAYLWAEHTASKAALDIKGSGYFALAHRRTGPYQSANDVIPPWRQIWGDMVKTNWIRQFGLAFAKSSHNNDWTCIAFAM